MPRSIVLSQPAVPGVIGDFRHQARDFAVIHGADQAAVRDLTLAVSEAVTNVVRHAYRGEEVGEIELTGSLHDGLIEILVSDRGQGFGATDSPGLGVGLRLIASLSSDLRISQSPLGTAVRMRFNPSG